MSPAREREASLAVVSDRPGEVADRIAALRELDGRRLEPLPHRELRDVYLDRPGGDLAAAGMALRVRTRGDGTRLLGLKGDERRLEGGGTDRLEVEGAWGEETLSRVRSALEAAGLPSAWLSVPADPGTPADALGGLGWRVVQDRRTVRRRRRLTGPGRGAGDGEAAGELTVDEVRFRPAGRPAVHREVEVEASPGRELPAGAVEALLARFPDGLRRWEPSKLATGRALDRLFGEGGDADVWTDADGALRPAAYDRLEELVAGG